MRKIADPPKQVFVASRPLIEVCWASSFTEIGFLRHRAISVKKATSDGDLRPLRLKAESLSLAGCSSAEPASVSTL